MALRWTILEGVHLADGINSVWRIHRPPLGHWVLWRRDKATDALLEMGVSNNEGAAKQHAEDLNAEEAERGIV